MGNPLLILLGGDILLAYASYALGYLLYKGDMAELFELLVTNHYGGLILMLVVVTSAFITGMYRLGERPKKRQILLGSLSTSTLAFLSLSTMLYQLEAPPIEGEHLVASLLLFAPLQFYWHARCHYFFSLSWFRKRVLIFGCGELALQVSESLHKDRGNPKLMGYIQLLDEDCRIQSDLILGTPENLRNIVLNDQIDTIIIAVSQRRGTIPVREIMACKLRGVRILDSNSFIEEVTGEIMVENINPSWIIFSEGIRMTPPIKILRRFMDMFCATLGLILSAPLMPFIIVALKLDSEGEIFFRQTRVGEGERIFTIYKFRTMRQDAEAESGAIWSDDGDPRITRFGKFMRKTRIDELPQLLNVLQGDMSFVGPRPERPEFVEFLKKKVPYYSYRHVVKPGITGWAQVRFSYGASVEDALSKLRFDLFYIKNYTPFLDVIIIVETIQVVLFGKGGR